MLVVRFLCFFSNWLRYPMLLLLKCVVFTLQSRTPGPRHVRPGFHDGVGASILLFLGYLALDCCARLPDGAVEKKERISPIAIFNSASTSACTASSCASAGFSGAARDPLTAHVRSRYRRSSLLAFALQKKSWLFVFSALCCDDPALRLRRWPARRIC